MEQGLRHVLFITLSIISSIKAISISSISLDHIFTKFLLSTTYRF